MISISNFILTVYIIVKLLYYSTICFFLEIILVRTIKISENNSTTNILMIIGFKLFKFIFSRLDNKSLEFTYQ